MAIVAVNSKQLLNKRRDIQTTVYTIDDSSSNNILALSQFSFNF